MSTAKGPTIHPSIEGRGVNLRPTTERDLGLLTRWFARPDVVKYWGGAPLPEAEVAAKYIGRRRPAVECFIVEADNTATGLIQYHHDGDRRGGIDMVLLEEHRRLGLGRAAAFALVAFLQEQLHWSDVTVDPDDWNDDGKAFWIAIGFEPLRAISDDHDRQPYVLMKWNGPG